MREMKLRVWWPDVKKLVAFDGPYIGCDALDRWGIHFPASLGTVYLGEGQIEQGTGLKDKNGKDIFEGDILVRAKKPGHGVVVYEAPEFVFKKGKHSLGLDVGPLEIIGNIHETPELLQDV